MAAAQRTTGYQREVAERNVEAILDAVEELLQSQGHANISAVAAQAGVSRVTVYAHFPDWAALLEAAVERAVRRTMAALQAVHPDDGPPIEALDRMLAATWQHLARNQAMAAAVAELLSPEAVTRTHQAAHHTIGALLARGQADGSFRTDLPARWLVTASIALVHACSDGVRAGHIEEHDAARILTTSVRDLLTGHDLGRNQPVRNTEPAISQDAAGQATAQQPDADPARPVRGAPAPDRRRPGRP